MGKFYTSGFLLLVLLFVETLQLCLCKNSSFNCIEEERQALLKFKHSLQGPSLLWLSSWKGTDCCKWKGVSCSRSTGHVVKLDLQQTKFSEFWNESRYSQYLMADEVNSCLLELRHLNYLDLSGINFQQTPFPKFFGLMKPLRYLNLSGTFFGGMVPSQLGNLTNLRALDLYSPLRDLAPAIQNVGWISHLLFLHHLDMSGIYLKRAFNLMQVLNGLPSLLVLRLASCALNNTHLSQAYVNSTFLSTVQYLDLHSNSFGGPIPHVFQNMTSLRFLVLWSNHFISSIPLWLGNFRSLVHLDLSDNSFEGPFPHVLQNMTSLRVLDLSYNSFNSSIPLWLGNFKSLVHLDLAYNEFDSIEGGLSMILWNRCRLKSLDLQYNRYLLRGESLEAYHNLSGCISYDLEALTLSYTGLTGLLPDSLRKLKKLKHLDLGGNSLYGPINPAWLGRLSTLSELDLSQNKLNGTIPDSLGQLINLESLDISSNSLEGVVSEVHFANLSRLEELYIGFNHLAFKAKSDWLPPFQLISISMGSCNIGPKFPQWLQTQSKVEQLHIPNANISEPMPKWLQFLPLFDLDLSHNQISGCLPQIIGDVMPTMISSLYLGDNLINGTIPSALCKIESLVYLDLSKNRLSGNIPNCWSVYQNLLIINLSSNKITGAIPSSIGNHYDLRILQLNNNSLTGELSLALKNCTRLELLDLGENGFYGNIPKWIGGWLWSLQILRLRNNMFNGSIPSQICNLFRLQILDLAENNLIGNIPDCFGNLGGMIFNGPLYKYPLELGSFPAGYLEEWDSESAMLFIKGRELEFKSILLLVVNVDLSCNNLIGTIPEELMQLSGLLGLNLSHNHLRGSIPKNIGNLTLLESLDFSTNQLSGLIPQSMSALTFLSCLNLSYNNFSGPIPTGNQLQTLNDPSIYAGNLELCGGPLPKKCPGDKPPSVPIPNGYEDDHREDKSEKVWFYITVMLGYMTGLWGVVGVLLFKRSWRYALFRFVDEIYDWIFVAVAVKAARLKKKMKRNHNAD